MNEGWGRAVPVVWGSALTTKFWPKGELTDLFASLSFDLKARSTSVAALRTDKGTQ
jgi:hypothetical protein